MQWDIGGGLGPTSPGPGSLKARALGLGSSP